MLDGPVAVSLNSTAEVITLLFLGSAICWDAAFTPLERGTVRSEGVARDLGRARTQAA